MPLIFYSFYALVLMAPDDQIEKSWQKLLRNIISLAVLHSVLEVGGKYAEREKRVCVREKGV